MPPPELFTGADFPLFCAWGSNFASAFSVNTKKENKRRSKKVNFFIVITRLTYYTQGVKIKIGLIFLILAAVVLGFLVLRQSEQKKPVSSAISEIKKNEPSNTLLDYTDPAGFSFSYPDNLSTVKNETLDNEYADITLSSKDISGSLNLKITDSKFKTLDEWAKLNKGEPAEKKLGNLKAMEVKTSDRLYLGALDQGILFTIEMPLLEEDFWMKVYEKVLSGFSFVAPAATAAAPDDVSFESEEVVE